VSRPRNSGTCYFGDRTLILQTHPGRTDLSLATPKLGPSQANFLAAQVPNQRIGTPEEIANAIAFIGSDKASYIIGASLAVDGGMIAD
jgi:NAD(P)-dependent dehydrogenase (short-subunit alcohol dehydrogenase family)